MNQLIKAAIISLVVGIALLLVKAGAYQLTGSAAVLSDALESIVNVITAIVAVAVLRFALAPADEEHPYGHGKAEYVSAGFEGGLIFFAAIAILLESVRVLIKGHTLRDLDLGFLLMLFAGTANLVLGLYLGHLAKKNNSSALAASSAHILSDFKTTLGVAIGMIAVKLTGWTWLDPLAAILVALHLAWEGWGIVRRSFSGLLDKVDYQTLDQLAAAFKKCRFPGIIEIHQLKVIRSGSFHHIDAHLVVPEFWDVHHAHELAESFEEAVVREYPFDGEIAFHLDPCASRHCRHCDLPNCSIRKENFLSYRSFQVSDLVAPPREGIL